MSGESARSFIFLGSQGLEPGHAAGAELAEDCGEGVPFTMDDEMVPPLLTESAWTRERQSSVNVQRMSALAGSIVLVAALVAIATALFAESSAAAIAAAEVSKAPVAEEVADFFAESEEEFFDACGNSIRLNDFQSRSRMEDAGWTFNWTDHLSFCPQLYEEIAPPESYWGLSSKGVGGVSLQVRGEGILTLDFGNLIGLPENRVSVYMNGLKVASAGPSELSKTIEMPFGDKDSLMVSQDPNGIILINQISIACRKTTTVAPETTKAHRSGKDDEDEKMKSAVEHFKEAHKKLEEASALTEKKEQERYAALRLKEAEEKAFKRKSEDDESAADSQKGGAKTPTTDKKDLAAKALALQDEQENRNMDMELVKALTAVLHDSEGDEAKKEKEKNADTSDEEQGDERDSGDAEDQDLHRNETFAKQIIDNAEKQIKKADEELEKAKQHEEEEAEKSAQAAKEIKEMIKVKAEASKKSDEEHHVETSTTTISTTLMKNPATVGWSLYCFTLMLPFGYEPSLLAAQKREKVGFFECDDFNIFSNSTTYLDGDGEQLPVSIDLVDFSLAVEYGGKWHTALNTPVFLKIWQKVRAMGRYLSHDWVVKADIDTVWFPERLRLALRMGIPQAVIPKSLRSRRLRGRKLQVSNGCNLCKQTGFENDPCEDHVRWLQKNNNKTCSEALAITSQPPPVDCGCECTSVEACDLSAEPNAWLDGHYMKGDLLSAKPAIYINNCRFGLHGPIEVFSSDAVTAFVEGLPQCDFLKSQPWGEDKYLDRCLMALGVTRVNIFSMLSEVACGEEPAPCGGADVAFHPFKKEEDYFACWDFANSFGSAPFENATKGGAEDVPDEQFL